MQLRQLEYFTALAAERHFTRAAERCHVSQPAFSEALRKLERELGVPLVKRGRAFEGLTPEGERLVVWARRLLADHDAMRAEAHALRGGISGQVRLGAVPSAAAVAAKLIAPFCARHPLATVRLTTHLSSTELLRQVRDFELDAGITFLHEGTDGLPTLELYEDRYVLLASRRLVPESADSITWAQASSLPMAALLSGMRGRTLVEDAFAQAKAPVRVHIETDSIASLCALVDTGSCASVVPYSWARTWELSSDLVVRRLAEPAVSAQMGVVFPTTTPTPPLAKALAEVAGRLKLS